MNKQNLDTIIVLGKFYLKLKRKIINNSFESWTVVFATWKRR